ncbi:MAG: ThiF family adenylyltransferase, partial [Duodenibacillus sp.]|nr:ThiF family adenylyltransferase [Duodenibacillus sp.]
RRFGGIERLYGRAAALRLASAHVCAVGVGGVGSWCVEALARSGVGALTLVDGDAVAESNCNRQLPAASDTLGLPKAEVLARRIALINPACRARAVTAFVAPGDPGALVPADADLIVDAIDDIAAKAALLAWARAAGRPVITACGAGGRTDPGAIKAADLAHVQGDALASSLRARLRKAHGFPAAAGRGKAPPFGIPAVYSDEPARGCAADAAASAGSGFGTAMPVTASLGLRAAALALEMLARGPDAPSGD